MLKYKLKIKKQRRRDIQGSRVHNALPTLSKWIHNRRDNGGNRAFRSRLGNDHHVVLHLLLNCMGKVIGLITNDVVSSERLWHGVASAFALSTCIRRVVNSVARSAFAFSASSRR